MDRNIPFRLLAPALLLALAPAAYAALHRVATKSALALSVDYVRMSTGEDQDLYGVVDALPLDGGRVAVYDNFQHRMTWWTDAAPPVLTAAVGGEGAGPGEFKSVRAVLGHDGEAVAFDISNQRLTFFDSSGQSGTTRSTAAIGGALGATPLGARGAVFNVVPFGRRPNSIAIVADLAAANEPAVVVHPDSLFGLERVLPVVGSGPGGQIYLGMEDAYRVVVLDSRGDFVREVVQPWKPVPLSAEELALRAGRGARFPLPGLATPTTQRSIVALAGDACNRLWVLTERGESRDAVFDVWDQRGSLVGEVTLSGYHVMRFALRGPHLYAVVRDRDDFTGWLRASGPALDCGG